MRVWREIEMWGGNRRVRVFGEMWEEYGLGKFGEFKIWLN
jgi:hypothetical protein